MNDQQNEGQFSPKESLQVIADMIEKVQNDKMRKLAKKRAQFKLTATYLVITSLMLVAIWYFTTGTSSYFWPAWPIGIFVFSILITYMEAYMGTSLFSEDKEYEKLKSKKR
ncbi:MAG: 2TM domain-containing protein [Bacteroidetes bacterium]|nr:2TM domain-containing protein [Bacteroidota bacterium]